MQYGHTCVLESVWSSSQTACCGTVQSSQCTQSPSYHMFDPLVDSFPPHAHHLSHLELLLKCERHHWAGTNLDERSCGWFVRNTDVPGKGILVPKNPEQRICIYITLSAYLNFSPVLFFTARRFSSLSILTVIL